MRVNGFEKGSVSGHLSSASYREQLEIICWSFPLHSVFSSVVTAGFVFCRELLLFKTNLNS